MKKFGIDISRWQGDFNFDKAIGEEIEFVIVKGGGGDDGLYKDAKFERNYTEAKNKGLPVGCYWFSRALSVEEALKEAEWFYNNIIKGKQLELPVYMDVEHSAMLKLGKEKLTEIVIAFCDKLEKLGCFAGVYSTKYYFSRYMNDAKLQRFAHWVAQWAAQCSYKGDENVLGMWQFGGETNLIRTNKVAGVTCDQNYMFLDYPARIKGAGLNGFSKTNSATHAPSKTINVGDRVKLLKNATIYGTNKKFAEFVYNSILFVREIKQNRVVISTLAEGAVTGAVDIKYIEGI